MQRARGVLFAVTTAVAVVAMVNPAAAWHASYAGMMVVSGSAGGTSTSTGNGSYMSLGFCPGSPTGGAVAPASGGSVVVTVSAGGGAGCQGSRLTEGSYDVHLENGPAWTIQNGQYVYNYSGFSRYLLGTLTVAAGKGSGSYSLPSNLTPNGASDASAIHLSLVTVPSNPNKRGIWTENIAPIAIT